MATMSALTVSGKVAHAANTAARCESVAAAAFAQAGSLAVSDSPADSQVSDFPASAKKAF